MASIDKAAIGWSIAIVAIGVAIAFAGQSGQTLGVDIQVPATIVEPSATESTTSQETVQADPFADIVSKVKEDSSKMAEKVEETIVEPVEETIVEPVEETIVEPVEETIVEPVEEAVTELGETVKQETEKRSPGPQTFTVSMPAGTSVPGCEETNECYIPASITIFSGDTVEWMNDDTAAHTVTAGSPADGPSGVFDSSLVLGGASYSFTFNDAGAYDYFCMVHPWMVGNVQVN